MFKALVSYYIAVRASHLLLLRGKKDLIVNPMAPMVPLLKILLDLPVHGKPEVKEKFGKTVNTLVGRSGAILTKKVKNNLLTVMLILSILLLTVQIGKMVVEHCCFILSHKMMDDNNDDDVDIGKEWKVFSVIYASIPEEHYVFLPTILLTLSNDEEATTTISSAASSIAQILSFVALFPNMFTQAAVKLDPGA
ncbi:hypothetical protein BDN71DRAFT_1432616 [Pleurotus eryngii]|uniref:Uncharacterized protein n=1 Tax=Pleurotus eryngii TaxID=5323 RepID=A0A9P5ZT44_PLEER|nr:hypothetical protein BDN71DRAFT_1432616 [Pleurotus eryngii]